MTLKSLTLDAERLLSVLGRLGQTNVPTDVDGLSAKLRTDAKAHSLQWLLNHLEPRLALIPNCGPIPANVRAAIVELHNIDPQGVTFRYSIDRSGKQTLRHQTLVDVRRVRDQLTEAHGWLYGGLGTWLDEERSLALEVASEYGP